MTFTITSIAFTLLHVALIGGVLAFLIRYRLKPTVRASFAEHTEFIENATQDIERLVHEISAAEKEFAYQEREVSRLSVAIEQWHALQEQRAAAAELEAREFARRLRERCEETIRIQGQQRTERTIMRRALSHARVLLMQRYAAEDAQQEYICTLCKKFTQGAPHEN